MGEPMAFQEKTTPLDLALIFDVINILPSAQPIEITLVTCYLTFIHRWSRSDVDPLSCELLEFQDPENEAKNGLGLLADVYRHLGTATWPGSQEGDDDLPPEDQQDLFRAMQFVAE